MSDSKRRGTEVQPGEAHLTVFVSSRIGELDEERTSVSEVIGTYFGMVARPWLFEYTLASSESLEESYLRKAGDCDIFVLIAGACYSAPVEAEVSRAVESGARILAFVKDTETRDPRVQAMLDGLDVKYARFGTASEFRKLLILSIRDELVRAYRRYRLDDAQLAMLIGLSSTDFLYLVPPEHGRRRVRNPLPRAPIIEAAEGVLEKMQRILRDGLHHVQESVTVEIHHDGSHLHYYYDGFEGGAAFEDTVQRCERHLATLRSSRSIVRPGYDDPLHCFLDMTLKNIKQETLRDELVHWLLDIS